MLPVRARQIPIHGLGDYADSLGGTEGIYVGDFGETVSRLPNRLSLHRHEYFEVFLLEGDGVHFNDFVSFPIKSPTLIFVSPGQVHKWKKPLKMNGYAICFTQQFFDGNAPPPSPILSYPFWYPNDTPPVLALPADRVEEITLICQELKKEFTAKAHGFESIIASLLRVLFGRAERLYPQRPSHRLNTRSSTLLRDFRLMLEQHFRTHQSVGAYAKLLNVSPDLLSQTVHEGTGQITGDVIRQRVLLESRRLLGYTQMTVSEVAYALSFQDPAYFSRFFRRLTGQSPGEFRDALEDKRTR